MKDPARLNTKAAELVAHFDAFARQLAIRGGMRRHAAAPLSRVERRAIAGIGDRPAWKMGELGRHLALGLSSLTAVLDRLVAKGLVERRRCDQDRRVVWVRLTPRGRRRYDQFRRWRFGVARGMLSALSEEEQERFIALMRKISQGVTGEKDRRDGRGGKRPAAR